MASADQHVIRFPDALQVALAAFLWGALGPMAHGLNGAGFSSGEVAALRVLICAVVLLAFGALWIGQARAIWRAQPGWALAHAVFGVVVYNLCFFAAIQSIGVARAVTLLYTAPMWALLFSWLLLGERPSPRQIVLALVALIGVLCVVGVFDTAATMTIAGAALGLASGAGYALYPVLGRRLMRQARPGAVMASSFVIAGVLLAIWPVSWAAAGHVIGVFSLQIVALVAGISVLGTLVAYLLFTRGLVSVPAPTAGVIATIEPVVGIVLAAGLFGEQLGASQLIGIALILAASAASAFRRPARSTYAT